MYYFILLDTETESLMRGLLLLLCCISPFCFHAIYKSGEADLKIINEPINFVNELNAKGGKNYPDVLKMFAVTTGKRSYEHYLEKTVPHGSEMHLVIYLDDRKYEFLKQKGVWKYFHYPMHVNPKDGILKT